MSQTEPYNHPQKIKPDFKSALVFLLLIGLGVFVTLVTYQQVDHIFQKMEWSDIPDDNDVFQSWDGEKRVNILLIGLDFRESGTAQKNHPGHADSIIILTYDPASQKTALLSIPRDMWVDIPGFGNGPINTAYSLGQANNLPGGGPVLMAQTVEHFLGIPINYYAETDIITFVEFINNIGCIDIKIPPEEDVIDITSGCPILHKDTKMFCGLQALDYLRDIPDRSSENGILKRSARQNTVLIAIQNQILNYYLMMYKYWGFSHLIENTPQIYDLLSKGIKTNLTPDMMIRLAWVLKDFPEKAIQNETITSEMVIADNAIGADGIKQVVIRPLPDQIHLLSERVFNPADNPNLVVQNIPMALQNETARIALQNGTRNTAILARTQAYLQSLHLNVVEINNASQTSKQTQMTIYTSKPYTIKFLADNMFISSSQINNQFTSHSDDDLLIVIGEDWLNNNPMPK